MKNKFLLMIKIAVIGLIALILLVPLSMIGGLITERQTHRHTAMQEVAKSWAESQRVNGPILAVPCVRTKQVKRWDPEQRIHVEHEEQTRFIVHLPPNELQVAVTVETEERYKGIYKFPVYTTKVRLTGNFDPASLVTVLADPAVEMDGDPGLMVGISDPRGIRSVPKLDWIGEQTPFEPGSHSSLMAKGIHAPLPQINMEDPKALTFAFTLDLHGMDVFEVVPLGRDTTIDYVANWPHPGFTGPFPPVTRNIGRDGFDARWQVTHFANPVDVYQVSERSVKYGFLFVALTFIAFFLHEVLKRLRIHPVQYGLVGIALAMFFLLLVSLSEHLAFGWSYLIAAVACVALLGFYVTHMLQSARNGGGFTLLVATLYATLYALLQLEDYALLTGAVLLFGVLALVMVLTRKLNWYQLSEQLQDKDAVDGDKRSGL